MDESDDAKSKIRSLRRADLVFPELSYQIVGALYDVYNELGPGHLERVYQRAVAEMLKQRNLKFEEQIPFGVQFHGKEIGKCYFDFFVENKIIVELKQGDRFRRQNIDQVIAYLKASNARLAILANFSREGVQFRRIVND